MSYTPEHAIQPTPGLAYEAYKAGGYSPMFPHAPYAARAAGPAFLATDGYWASGPTVPSNLRGLGLDLGGSIEQYLDKTVQGVINRNWPTFDKKMNESMAPLKVLLAMTVVASGAAAVIGYLNYTKRG